MTNSTINKDDLFRAILAVDVYHRGYNAALNVSGTQIGNALVGNSSSKKGPNNTNGALIGDVLDSSIGFYAQEYTIENGTKKIIAYRGTDDGIGNTASIGDLQNSYGIAVGRPARRLGQASARHGATQLNGARGAHDVSSSLRGDAKATKYGASQLFA